MKRAKVSEDDITDLKIKHRWAMTQYRNFSKTMKLPMQEERISMDGLGRV